MIAFQRHDHGDQAYTVYIEATEVAALCDNRTPEPSTELPLKSGAVFVVKGSVMHIHKQVCEERGK